MQREGLFWLVVHLALHLVAQRVHAMQDTPQMQARPDWTRRQAVDQPLEDVGPLQLVICSLLIVLSSMGRMLDGPVQMPAGV
jgi:hypothetical protein